MCPSCRQVWLFARSEIGQEAALLSKKMPEEISAMKRPQGNILRPAGLKIDDY
jgi:hypothetical protein